MLVGRPASCVIRPPLLTVQNHRIRLYTCAPKFSRNVGNVQEHCQRGLAAARQVLERGGGAGLDVWVDVADQLAQRLVEAQVLELACALADP